MCILFISRLFLSRYVYVCVGVYECNRVSQVLRRWNLKSMRLHYKFNKIHINFFIKLLFQYLVTLAGLSAPAAAAPAAVASSCCSCFFLHISILWSKLCFIRFSFHYCVRSYIGRLWMTYSIIYWQIENMETHQRQFYYRIYNLLVGISLKTTKKITNKITLYRSYWKK